MRAAFLVSVAFAFSGNGNGNNLWGWLGHGDETMDQVKQLIDGAPQSGEDASVAAVESSVESSILNADNSESTGAGAGDAPEKPSDFATRKSGPGGMIAIPLDS